MKFTQLLSDGSRFKPIGYPRWPGFRQVPSQLSGVGGHLDSPTLKVTSISDSPTHTLQRQSVDFSIQHPTPQIPPLTEPEQLRPTNPHEQSPGESADHRRDVF